MEALNPSHRLIWISPVIPQSELEEWYHWVNAHLASLGFHPLFSFSRIQTRFTFEPVDSLRLEIEVQGSLRPDAVPALKEALWSEIFAGSHPGPRPFLIALLPEETLRIKKRLICFDMDSTLINEEVIDEIAREAGFYEEVSRITESAMRGEMDFEKSLRARVSLFKGMPKARAENIIPSLHLSPGGEKLLSSLRSLGLKTAVVSGGFEFILRHFQKTLFLDQVYGNTLLTDEEERFTGELDPPLVDASYKQKLVARMKENYGFTIEETLIAGDGANDILMMKEAGISISFCGKPRLSAEANTWILDRNLLWIKALI